jgi:hypothetical protein
VQDLARLRRAVGELAGSLLNEQQDAKKEHREVLAATQDCVSIFASALKTAKGALSKARCLLTYADDADVC